MRDRLAFMTLAVLREPIGSPVVQGFMDRVAKVYAEADGSAGFFARSVRDLATWRHSWGDIVLPACVPAGIGLDQIAVTLSLWADLESVAAFAYRGLHGEALSRRAEWFERGDWPSLVAWWVPETHQPDWVEGAARIDHLHQHGPSPHAFTMRKPFDAAGAATRLDTQALAALKRA